MNLLHFFRRPPTHCLLPCGKTITEPEMYMMADGAVIPAPDRWFELPAPCMLLAIVPATGKDARGIAIMKQFSASISKLGPTHVVSAVCRDGIIHIIGNRTPSLPAMIGGILGKTITTTYGHIDQHGNGRASTHPDYEETARRVGILARVHWSKENSRRSYTTSFR